MAEGRPTCRSLEGLRPPGYRAARSVGDLSGPGLAFDFKEQNALDLHIALGVEPDTFESMLQKAKAEGREVRGPVDHGFVRSIYFRDPNGYVIELTASTGTHGEMMDPAISKPHAALERWHTAKSH